MSNGRPLLYLSRPLPAPVMETIRQRYRLVSEPREEGPSTSELQEGLRDAEAAIVTLLERIDAASLSRATRLRVLANYAVGYNNIDLASAESRGLVVTNTPDVLTDATADLTWALLLATARRVVEGDAVVRSGRWTGWTATQLLGAEVAGKTLGIIGMGRIGRAVAERGAGFRMNLLYFTRQRPANLPAQWRATGFSDLLGQSDFVSLHVPLTDMTHHLIGAKALSLMKRTAVLINTARGPVVDEAALIAALQDGVIAGAGLDVYEDEPHLRAPLIALPQVVLLPHLGSATWAARVRMGMMCLENIEAVLAGRPALNPVTRH
ncbi:MAG TPA: D-glycerate dehydrogenase [Nitrospira sp.]|nr:D-glycerate dehydrogenase [Nitrospira sp.]